LANNQLVVIFLNKVECLEDLLTGFLELGVSGATVVDSVGMGRILSHNVPIFAGLSSAFPGSSPGNKVIMAVVDATRVEEIADLAEEVCGSFDSPATGLLIALPVGMTRGFRPGFE
jgi:nitrogen regulatory protein P-II 1